MKSKNTYSLLVSSEEKSRSIFETVVYGLVVVSMAFAVFAFVSQSVTVPRMPRASAVPAQTEVIAATPARPPLVATRG